MLLEENVCYDLCVFLAKLLAFALFNHVLQGQMFLLLQGPLGFMSPVASALGKQILSDFLDMSVSPDLG